MDDEQTAEPALESELAKCRRPLRDFQANPEDHAGFAYASPDRRSVRFSVNADLLPVPTTAELAMRMLVRAHNLGRAEKLAWEFPFSFRGRACSLTLQKFGMYLYLESDQAGDGSADDAAMAEEIQRKLSSATRSLERHVLAQLAKEQTAAGNVTVRNQFGQLREMYRYFRRVGRDAYAGQGLLAKGHDRDNAGGLLREHLRFMFEDTEGLFATVAMTNAYFSLLEHLLVLVLPATSFDPSVEPVTEFILSHKLNEKFQRVFRDSAEPGVARMLERIRVVLERWRNPYGHGGFDKGHGTLAFHVPSVGAVPVLMSEYRNHPTFRFVPARDEGYDELCAFFDEIDAWLRRSSVWAGVAWAEAALDVRFDSEFLTQFRAAAALGDEAFQSFLMDASYAADIADNMDW